MNLDNDMVYYGLFGLMFFWLAYSMGWIFVNFKMLNAKDAVSMMEENKDMLILDVRTQAEYDLSHLKGATLMPVAEIIENINKLEKHKEKDILVYCHSGGRSVSASRFLKKSGFTPINIKGGIMALEHNGADVT